VVEYPFVRDNLFIRGVRLIQAIPITCTNHKDILKWRGTKNGVFFMKSAYHLQKEVESVSRVGNSSRGEVNKI
jgi:hypothetical protein